MLKKMMLLAVAAAALAVPAAAQANPLLHDKDGNLPVGAEVTATSKNLVTHSAVGKLECALVTIHGKVVENTTTKAVIGPNSVTVQGCNNPITNQGVGTITLGGGEGLGAGATFVAGGLCHFSGNIPFDYKTNTDEITIVGTNQLNGNCGPATMTGSFTLETNKIDPATGLPIPVFIR